MDDLNGLFIMVEEKKNLESELQNIKQAITDKVVADPGLVARYMRLDMKAVERDMIHEDIEGQHVPSNAKIVKY